MVVLERFCYSKVGTFGELFLPSGKVLQTCEDPDNANQHGISCIPEGEYLCIPDFYHKGNYPCYQVTGVPGRDRILIHKGNSDEDVQGCIVVGMRFPGWIAGKGLSIEDSAGAFALFMTEMNNQRFTLQIRPRVPSKEIRYG